MANEKQGAGKQTQSEQQQREEKPAQPVRQAQGQSQRGMQRRAERQPLGRYGWGTELSPFSMMRRMVEDMDRFFEDFGMGFGGIGRGLLPDVGGGESTRWWSPQLDVERRGDSLVVTADLPGLTESDVQVEVDDGVLVISGERKQESHEERGGVYRSERRYGSFHREIALPEGVNAEDAEATFKDGVLTVTLKLQEQKEQPRRIPIQGAKSPAEGTPEPAEGSAEAKEIH